MNEINVILANNTEYALLQPAELRTRYESGAQREVMTLKMPAGAYPLDTLAAAFADEANTGLLRLRCGEEEYAYPDYVLLLGVGLKTVAAQPETPDAPASSELYTLVELGRLTYIEKQLRALGIRA